MKIKRHIRFRHKRVKNNENMAVKRYESTAKGTIILGKMTEKQLIELDLIKGKNLKTEDKLCEEVEC